MAAAVVAGAAADLVGDGAHIGRGVERVEYEVGGLRGGVVEGGADQGAIGAERIEQGVDDSGRGSLDLAQAAEGALRHEDLAGAHPKAPQVVRDAVAVQSHAWWARVRGACEDTPQAPRRLICPSQTPFDAP